MNTHTHVLLAAAVFGRRGMAARNLAAVSGSLFPDLPLYGLFVGSKLMGIEERRVWRELYWSEPWPTILGATHSFVLLGILLLFGLWLRRRPVSGPEPHAAGTRGASGGARDFLAFFAGAALLHAATDFPLHREDAHQQFWPLSSFRFRSPVSYWDAAHYGNVWMTVETLLGVALAVILWRRFPQWWVRALAAAAILLYAAVPAYFFLNHHSG